MQTKFSTERLLWLSVSINVVLVCGAYLLSEHGFSRNKSGSLAPHWRDSKNGDKGVVIDKPWEFVVNYPVDFENATAVFNSVQGALKQKSDNMHPVGVSFIPAYIPPNTLMYHATGDKNIPESFEWIAMDNEFSYDFAHVFGNHKGGHGGPGGPGGPGGHGPGGPGDHGGPPAKRDDEDAKDDVSVNEQNRRSYMYAFKNTKPFNKVILLDGASAAKTTTGEMDQQLILSRMDDPTKRVDEREAAKVICKWGESFGLQGFIRLEIGYEMVLCDFIKDVDFVSNVTLGDQYDFMGFPAPKVDEDSVEKRDQTEVEGTAAEKELANARTSILEVASAMAGIEHVQAGHRVDQGESRIQLDFSKMVTPLNKTYIDPNPYYRRINNISDTLKDGIISELENHFKGEEGADPVGKTNWQLITNQVVEKFTPILLSINNTLSAYEYHKNSEELGDNLKVTAGNLTKSTYNFVRRYTQSKEARGEKANVRELTFQASALDWVYHTFPLTTSSEALIYSSIYEVYLGVFNIIYDTLEVSKVILQDIVVDPSPENYAKHQKEVEELKLKVNALVTNLRWDAFSRCSKVCGWDEACYVPTWGPGPVGWGSGGSNSKWFEFDGSRYVIGNELKCLNFSELIRH